MCHSRHWLYVIAIAAACLWPRAVQSAAPTLTRLFPAGGQRGSTFTVTCSGEFDWPVSVWSPGIDATPGEASGQLTITIPPDLATDRVWLRLYNAEGASQVVPFLIGNLAEVNEMEPNNSPTAAQRLDGSRMTVNGVLEDRGDVDGFAVSLTAGSTLVADVDAHDKLGSPMDAILQVVSSDGFVLAENHDDIGLDPRIAFEVPADGEYIVRLFAFPSEPDSSVNFRGDANYVYRLTITDGPFVSHTIPSVVSRDNPGDVEVRGWNIPPGMRVPVTPLAAALIDECGEIENHGDQRTMVGDSIGFLHDPSLAGAARVRMVPFAVVNSLAAGTQESPQALQQPTSITGLLSSRDQVDYFDLPLAANLPIIISVESRGIELPVQPVVTLIDPTGSQAAEFDKAEPGDAVIAHTPAQDGIYRLTVRDRFREHGEQCAYRLTVWAAEPDFTLTAESDAIVVKPGEPTTLGIVIQRQNTPNAAIGPITIEAVNLPPDVTAASVTSEVEGDTAQKVTLTFESAGGAFSGPVRLVGRTSQPAELERFVRTPTVFETSLSVIWLTAVGSTEADATPE